MDLDRRLFIGAGLAAFALPRFASAQTPHEPTISERIARFIVEFDLASQPPLAIERAHIAFVDTVGVMLAGSRQGPSKIITEMVREEAAPPAVSVVGQSLRTTPQLAALANGVAAHAMDYDFTYLAGQIVSPVIPAVLPLAEKLGASEDEVLAAFMVGFEVASRISRANPTHTNQGGWHATSTIGTPAAAAACARLMKVPAAAIPDVMGIGVSLASGISVNFGTMTKPLHSGQAARNGMMAALLGARGFTASATAFEGNAGFFKTFARGLDWSPAPFDDLGKRSDLAEWGFTIKPYPSGGLGHTAIDAALELREALGPRVAEIAAVKVGVTDYASQRIGSQYPKTVESAKFSLPYLTAYALVHGAPRIPAFTEAAIEDGEVRALASKVTGHVDPEFATLRVNTPSRVVVTLGNGETLERVKWYQKGTTQNPLSPEEVEAKFMDCAALSIDAATAKRILARLRGLGGKSSLTELWPLLRIA